MVESVEAPKNGTEKNNEVKQIMTNLFTVPAIRHQHEARVALALVRAWHGDAVVGTQLIWSVVFAKGCYCCSRRK